MIKLKSLMVTFAVMATLVFSLGAATVQAADEQPAAPLYDRLGGIYPISMVVDTFVDRVLENDLLNANPAIKAAGERVPKSGLKFHVTSLVCQHTGGPCNYTGRGMKATHAHLAITEEEWQAMLTDFGHVLNSYGVPAPEQQELVAILESTKKDIVTGR